MIDALPYPVAVALVAVAGLAAHEGCHYVVARAAGADPSFTYMWQGWFPNPAVDPGPGFPFTPATWFATVLAPLAVALPSTLAFAAFTPTGDAIGLAVMWLLTTMPSPPDWRMAYNAGDARVLQAVMDGEHPNHTAAEGYA